MNISEALDLIPAPTIERSQPQSWCDLGCGSGTFTIALAQSLASGSTIHAVDRDPKALARIPDEHHGVAIRKVLEDLRTPGLRLPSVDGILMANFLHFIQDQHLFLRKLQSLTHCFLIVEYERSKPSPWVPYPIGFERLCELLTESGMERVEKLAMRRSRFGGTMYSALAERSR
jgi:hypothetical protein